METISIPQYLANPGKIRVIDVRTAEEYSQGAIPGSINIPLFDHQQRVHIGTVYQRSPRAARFVAMDLLAPRLARYIRKIHRNCYGHAPLIVCWRGGMRSSFTVGLLHMAGVRALQLEGGYRAYRRWVYSQLREIDLNLPLVVLKGKTGTGKTALLHALATMGLQVLDLETLAGHRGSAFGDFPDDRACSQKDFDARLLLCLQQLDADKWLAVEGESKRIGNIYLPDNLYSAMRNAPVIEIHCSMDLRVQRILDEYTPREEGDLKRIYAALARLQQRLGVKVHSELKNSLEAGNYAVFVQTLLEQHYDKVYDFQLPGKEVLFAVDTADIKKAAMEIAARLNKLSFPAGKT